MRRGLPETGRLWLKGFNVENNLTSHICYKRIQNEKIVIIVLKLKVDCPEIVKIKEAAVPAISSVLTTRLSLPQRGIAKDVQVGFISGGTNPLLTLLHFFGLYNT